MKLLKFAESGLTGKQIPIIVKNIAAASSDMVKAEKKRSRKAVLTERDARWL